MQCYVVLETPRAIDILNAINLEALLARETANLKVVAVLNHTASYTSGYLNGITLTDLLTLPCFVNKLKLDCIIWYGSMDEILPEIEKIGLAETIHLSSYKTVTDITVVYMLGR